MQVQQVIQHLETIAPPSYQESYDNAGLLVGDPQQEVTGVLTCLDSTEAVLDEAQRRGCNLVVAHHPIVFRGLKRLTGKNYVERVVMQAIRQGIAIYAIHTNLDNVYHRGVNGRIAEQLGLINTRILAPKGVMKKLVTYVAADHSDTLRRELVKVGAGQLPGQRGDRSHAGLGVAYQRGQGRAEVRLEFHYAAPQEGRILRTLRQYHPESPVPYEVHGIDNRHPEVGSGLIGELAEPAYEKPFLQFVKKAMKVGVIRHTRLRSRKIGTVALCGGAGGFVLGRAKAAGAGFFITADYKYHEFFDADGEILIADIGHYESEQYTVELLSSIISTKFRTFAVYSTEVNTNPVKYT